MKRKERKHQMLYKAFGIEFNCVWQYLQKWVGRNDSSRGQSPYKQGIKAYHVRIYREIKTIYLRYLFDPIDRSYIEVISKKYQSYIEEMCFQI